MKRSVLYTDDLVKGHQFAHLLCTAYQRSSFVALQRFDGVKYANVGGWVGPYEGELSRAPFFAQAKLAELNLFPGKRGLLVTPTNLPESLGLAGAARLGKYSVGCSRWASEHDKLLALVLLYSLEYEVRLHHVGTRFPTQQEFEEASAEFSDKPIYVPAPDHVRHYHHVESELSANREYWAEFQYFPNGPFTPAVHWDLATANPYGLLFFIADAFKTQTVYFDQPGKHDPVGAVWIAAKSGGILGVMAREYWSDPAERVK